MTVPITGSGFKISCIAAGGGTTSEESEDAILSDFFVLFVCGAEFRTAVSVPFFAAILGTILDVDLGAAFEIDFGAAFEIDFGAAFEIDFGAAFEIDLDAALEVALFVPLDAACISTHVAKPPTCSSLLSETIPRRKYLGDVTSFMHF